MTNEMKSTISRIFAEQVGNLEKTDFVAELKKRTFFCPDNDTEYSGAEILSDFYEFGEREYYPIDVKGLKSYLSACLDKNGSLYETISKETAKKYYPLATGFEPLCGGTRLDCKLYDEVCNIARSYSEDYVVMFERVEIPECKTTGYYFAVNGEPIVFGNMIHNPLSGIWRLDDLLFDSAEKHFSIEIIKIN